MTLSEKETFGKGQFRKRQSEKTKTNDSEKEYLKRTDLKIQILKMTIPESNNLKRTIPKRAFSNKYNMENENLPND